MWIRTNPLLELAFASSNVGFGLKKYIESKGVVKEEHKKFLEYYKNLLKILKESFVVIPRCDLLNEDTFEKILKGKLPIDKAQKLKKIVDRIALESLLRFRYNFYKKKTFIIK